MVRYVIAMSADASVGLLTSAHSFLHRSKAYQRLAYLRKLAPKMWEKDQVWRVNIIVEKDPVLKTRKRK